MDFSIYKNVLCVVNVMYYYIISIHALRILFHLDSVKLNKCKSISLLFVVKQGVLVFPLRV